MEERFIRSSLQDVRCMVPTDSSRGQIDVGWECETVFTNQLIPTRIVKAVQRKQALVTLNVFPFWMSPALVAQYWRDLHRRSLHPGPPTPLEFVGHPRLGCAGDNPCLERCRELSYRPRPPAGVLRCLWRYQPQIMRTESLSSNLRGSCFHGELCVLLLFAFSLPDRHLCARRRLASVGGFPRFDEDHFLTRIHR
jgi:hypothetical protein